MTQETKLTEPVQVGLWYETKARAIVKMDYKFADKNECHAGRCYTANNHLSYSEAGICGNSDHDLIRCLGADPFKQVQPPLVATEAGTVKVFTPDYPTQFERIFTAALQGIISNTNYAGCSWENTARNAIEYTQEAIKQLKEIEGA